MPKSHGPRRKSRAALRKRVREKGKLGLSRLLTKYEVGEKVIIKTSKYVVAGPEHIMKQK